MLHCASDHSPTTLPPTNGIHILIDPSADSSYTKLYVTACILCFVHNTREKLKGPLTPSELQSSMGGNVKHRSFLAEINSLQSSNHPS